MEVYETCHEPFLKYCSAITYGKMDTEDLVQDILLSAYQQFERIEEKDKMLHYLIRAAKNRMVSRWRRDKHRGEYRDKYAERLTTSGCSPDLLVDIGHLYEALDQLSTSQRDAVILYEISGFSMKEIADMQGSTEGAVKTKVSRGRNRLKEILDTTHGESRSGLAWKQMMMLL